MSDCFSREFLMQQARDSSYATDISTESAEAYIGYYQKRFRSEYKNT